MNSLRILNNIISKCKDTKKSGKRKVKNEIIFFNDNSKKVRIFASHFMRKTIIK
jgi:hypothetical protein